MDPAGKGYGTNQGYPPQPAAGQGYPPQAAAGQGYPPQPAAGQGYPPQPAAGQGYPPQPAAGQGYPPQTPGQSTPSAPPADDDVMDNAASSAPVPSAPPLEKMDDIPGYNNIGFNTANYEPPPSYDEAMAQPTPPQRPPSSVRPLTAEECQAALVEHARSECCWGSGAARDLVIKDIKHSPVFHYILETFGEARSTAWAYEPYNGGLIDSPANGRAPAPWEIPVPAPTMFSNTEKQLEVPHTASIKACHDCLGNGKRQCHQCRGRGWLKCHHCHGRHHRHGSDHNFSCTWCKGDRRMRCSTCHTLGMVKCSTCKGSANLKCYIKLTVNWTNHQEHKVQDDCTLPQDMIHKVTGDVVFKEEQPLVWPINHFPDQRINNASKSLVDKHRTCFPSERIIRQRHRVQIVPIAEVTYEWKGRTPDTFWVYGHETLVYAPKYPQQCCCGCTIL